MPLSQVLSHLTKKRPVGADRTQFFAHAEAFAVLVNIEFVSIDGAYLCAMAVCCGGCGWCRGHEPCEVGGLHVHAFCPVPTHEGCIWSRSIQGSFSHYPSQHQL